MSTRHRGCWFTAASCGEFVLWDFYILSFNYFWMFFSTFLTLQPFNCLSATFHYFDFRYCGMKIKNFLAKTFSHLWLAKPNFIYHIFNLNIFLPTISWSSVSRIFKCKNSNLTTVGWGKTKHGFYSALLNVCDITSDSRCSAVTYWSLKTLPYETKETSVFSLPDKEDEEEAAVRSRRTNTVSIFEQETSESGETKMWVWAWEGVWFH